MKCWHCDTELIWGGDHGIGTDGIVTNLSCPNCPTTVFVYTDIEEEEDQE